MTRTLGISVAALVGALTLLGGGGEPPVLAPASTNGIALVEGTLIDGTGAAPVRDSVVLNRGKCIERCFRHHARGASTTW